MRLRLYSLKIRHRRKNEPSSHDCITFTDAGLLDFEYLSRRGSSRGRSRRRHRRACIGRSGSREDGFFDGMVNEFYGLMKLVCLGLILWNAVPLVWTYLLKKEVKKNGVAGKV